MDGLTAGDGAQEQGGFERLLLLPLNRLSRRDRWIVVALATVLVTLWCRLRNGNLMVAWGLPDVAFYIDMAHRRYDLVPQPFSARPLAPLLARWIAAPAHVWVQGGFKVLAYLSLVWTLGVVFWLLVRSAAPRFMLLMVAAVPFWPQLLGHAGLPDPLYAALICGLLVALEREWVWLAAALMFPLMLARESTSLTLLCLLLVAWRRLGWGGGVLAVAGVAAGALVVGHVSAGGLPNPEHMSGGLYMIGKVASNSLRSTGVVPWSNVYPELCQTPAWQMRLHVGPVRAVGVCRWSEGAPLQAVWAFVTTFGALPALLPWACWASCKGMSREGLLVRFCLLYGGLSFLLAPTLGTWYARLFGYGWPLLLVAVPRLWRWTVERETDTRGAVWLWTVVVGLHLLLCAFEERTPGRGLVLLAGVLEALAAALLLVHARSARHAPREA